jgi:hypothetical protein
MNTTKWTGWETDKYQGYVEYLNEVETILDVHDIDWAYYHSPIFNGYGEQKIISDNVYFVDQCGNEVATWHKTLNVLLVFGKPRKVCRKTNPDGIRNYRREMTEYEILSNKVYESLMKNSPYFRNLSMDMQGELIMNIVKKKLDIVS